MQNLPIKISFDNVVAEHVAADRLYYKSTVIAKIDKVVAAILVIAGLMIVYSVGVRWWALIPFGLAVLEWFNLLSPRPLVIRYWFAQNPKFRETYQLTFDDTGIHFLTQSIDSRITWEPYTKVLENDRMWLLVYGRRMYTVVPSERSPMNTTQPNLRS